MRPFVFGLLAAGTLLVASQAPLAGQQLYECTTKTTTTTVYSHDELGNYYVTTVTVVSRVCVPIAT
jgi:long-subunit fatty acid transport protein